MYRGDIRGLHRWPVKSLRGERVTTARLDHRGMAGDRAYSLLDERPDRAGKQLTVRQMPRMLAWEAAYPATCDGSPEPPGDPVLYDADGAAWGWDDPGLPAALAEAYDLPLSLHAADGQQDRGPTVLVTFEASLRALAEEMGAEVDLLRFRPNIHLDADVPRSPRSRSARERRSPRGESSSPSPAIAPGPRSAARSRAGTRTAANAGPSCRNTSSSITTTSSASSCGSSPPAMSAPATPRRSTRESTDLTPPRVGSAAPRGASLPGSQGRGSPRRRSGSRGPTGGRIPGTGRAGRCRCCSADSASDRRSCGPIGTPCSPSRRGIGGRRSRRGGRCRRAGQSEARPASRRGRTSAATSMS